jgi:hypothetical protein
MGTLMYADPNDLILNFTNFATEFCSGTLPDSAIARCEGFAALWHRPLDGLES